MAQNKYKVVSLFSGAMGLDIGLESTDRFDVLACVEKEKAFCDTIRANHAAKRLHHKLKERTKRGQDETGDETGSGTKRGTKRGQTCSVEKLIGRPMFRA